MKQQARKLAIVTRSDGEPAWKDAPPRLRQSQVTRKVEPMERTGSRWFKWGAKQ